MILKAIKNNARLRNIYINTLSKHWVNEKVSRFTEYLTPGSTVADIGAGNGLVALVLQHRGFAITAVDVADLSIIPAIKTTVYDGQTLPFPDNHFTSALLLTVLHHTDDPVAVLQETARTARQVVIIEDVYTNVVQKYLTFAMDTLVNFGHSNMTYQNRSVVEWEAIFRELGLVMKVKKEKRVLGIFRQVVFVLGKE